MRKKQKPVVAGIYNAKTIQVEVWHHGKKQYVKLTFLLKKRKKS